MKIYVDFDRTLLDCDRFLDDLYTIINQFNVSKELFKECQNQCKKKGFNPVTILNLVKEKEEFNDELYIKIDNLIRNTSDYLYCDTIVFLEYLKSLNLEVIILTRGNSDYQREKIFNAKIDSYYNKLIVTMKHKGNLNIDYENSIFIDDNPREIGSILKRNPKMVIRIQRDNSKYSNIPLEIDIKCVKSLNEIVENKILN